MSSLVGISLCSYALWRLVHAGRNVLYEYPKGLAEHGVPICIGDPKSDVYIADGLKPTVAGPATLFISSPRGGGAGAEIYKEYQKRASTRFMPAPTPEEVLLMAKYCFTHKGDAVSEDQVQERIERWGPIPRFVLQKVAIERETLEKSIKAQNVVDLRRLVRSMDDPSAVKVSFRVVHYNVDDTFSKVTYRWASPYVGKRVVQVLQAEQEVDRLALLADLLKETHWLDMSSGLFEDWCSMRMAAGGSFRIRRLGVGSTSGVGKGNAVKNLGGDAEAELFRRADAILGVDINSSGIGSLVMRPAARTVSLVNAEEPLVEGTAHVLPAASQFSGERYRTKTGTAAVDFVESSGVCCNATVNPQHSLVLLGKNVANGLLPIVSRLQPGVQWGPTSGTPVPFLWLVPPIIFEKCRPGVMEIETPPASKAAAASDAAAENYAALRSAAREMAPWVVQYAVEILPPADATPKPSATLVHDSSAGPESAT